MKKCAKNTGSRNKNPAARDGRAGDDSRLWRFVRKTVKRYARKFDLPLHKVKLLSSWKFFYGYCSNDGRIWIQLREGDVRLLAYQIIDTMSHELAHLRHNNHKPAWFALHVEILSAMTKDGVFRRLRKLCKHS